MSDNSYERYLSGRYFEDSICVSIEEDVICNEINLVKFIGRYQYISSKDVQYFFDDTYYPKRITKLIKKSL